MDSKGELRWSKGKLYWSKGRAILIKRYKNYVDSWMVLIRTLAFCFRKKISIISTWWQQKKAKEKRLGNQIPGLYFPWLLISGLNKIRTFFPRFLIQGFYFVAFFSPLTFLRVFCQLCCDLKQLNFTEKQTDWQIHRIGKQIDRQVDR